MEQYDTTEMDKLQMTAFNCDILFGIRTDKRQALIYLQGNDEIRSAIRWILLAIAGLCLSFVRQLLDKAYEPIVLMAIAEKWVRVYAIELAELLCGNSKTILSWG